MIYYQINYTILVNLDRNTENLCKLVLNEKIELKQM